MFESIGDRVGVYEEVEVGDEVEFESVDFFLLRGLRRLN